MTLRSMLLAVQRTLVLAAALALIPAVAMAQSDGFKPPPGLKPPPEILQPRPLGLVAVIANDPKADSLDLEPFFSPYIQGVALQIHWSDIEPAPGQMDWSRLDTLFLAAHFTGKWVHLLIFPGFFSPQWVLDGAKTDQFPIQYGPGSKKQDHFAPLPMPWNEVYLNNWFDFLQQLSVRYGAYPEFKMIAAAGPTSVSDEFTEPGGIGVPGWIEFDNILKWQVDGYTSTRYIDAWKRVFDAYADIFPNQYISLSHGNGVEIDANGNYDRHEPTHTRQAIVNEGIDILGSRFAFQSSALTGDPKHHAGAIQMVRDYNGRIVTGFQLGASCEKSPDYMGAPGNPPLALWNSLLNAMQPNDLGYRADYIEIHATDIEAPDLQSILWWDSTLYWPYL